MTWRKVKTLRRFFVLSGLPIDLVLVQCFHVVLLSDLLDQLQMLGN
jgi:hypothetical protein